MTKWTRTSRRHCTVFVNDCFLFCILLYFCFIVDFYFVEFRISNFILFTFQNLSTTRLRKDVDWFIAKWCYDTSKFQEQCFEICDLRAKTITGDKKWDRKNVLTEPPLYSIDSLFIFVFISSFFGLNYHWTNAKYKLQFHDTLPTEIRCKVGDFLC